MTARCRGGNPPISRSMASRSSYGVVGSGTGAMSGSSDSRDSGIRRAARRRRQDRNSLTTMRLTYRSGASSRPMRARWARIGRLDAPERYVKRMVVNEFLSWRRRRAARLIPLSRESLDPLMAPVPDPTTPYDERDAMLRLIGGLPPRQRAVIALRFYEEMSVEEIADLLGCRTVTVRTHLCRALAALREALPASLITVGG